MPVVLEFSNCWENDWTCICRSLPRASTACQLSPDSSTGTVCLGLLQCAPSGHRQQARPSQCTRIPALDRGRLFLSLNNTCCTTYMAKCTQPTLKETQKISLIDFPIKKTAVKHILPKFRGNKPLEIKIYKFLIKLVKLFILVKFMGQIHWGCW